MASCGGERTRSGRTEERAAVREITVSSTSSQANRPTRAPPSSVALIAVADVTAYDYWPVRGFVKSAIHAQSTKLGVDIFCDWDGHVREGLGLRRGTSNVVLYGRNGHVLFAASGELGAEDRAKVVSALRREVEG
jgi:hypothetical protein